MSRYRGSGHADLKAFHGTAVSKYVGKNMSGVFEYTYQRRIPDQGKGFIEYLPNLANMNLLYCMENNISSMHMAPRMGFQSTTLCLGMLYKLSKNPEAIAVVGCTNRNNKLLFIQKAKDIYLANRKNKIIGLRDYEYDELFNSHRIISFDKWLKHNEKYRDKETYIFIDDMCLHNKIDIIPLAFNSTTRKEANVKAIFCIGTYIQNDEDNNNNKVSDTIDMISPPLSIKRHIGFTLGTNDGGLIFCEATAFNDEELFWFNKDTWLDTTDASLLIKTDYKNVYCIGADDYITTMKSILPDKRTFYNEVLLQKYNETEVKEEE